MEHLDQLIPQSIHHITNDKLSENAIFVVKNLVNHGFESYLVGGCVRDLFLGKQPKDFDVTTAATPEEVVKVFNSKETTKLYRKQFASKNTTPYAKIIGKRFKIVHITFMGEEIIEVATFRAKSESDTLKKSISDKNTLDINLTTSALTETVTDKPKGFDAELNNLIQDALDFNSLEEKFENFSQEKNTDYTSKQYILMLQSICPLYKSVSENNLDTLPNITSFSAKLKTNINNELLLSILAHSVIMNLQIDPLCLQLIQKMTGKFRQKFLWSNLVLFSKIVSKFSGIIPGFTSKFVLKLKEFDLWRNIFPMAANQFNSPQSEENYCKFIDHNIRKCCSILDFDNKKCAKLITLIMLWPSYTQLCRNWFLPYIPSESDPSLKDFYDLVGCQGKLNETDVVSFYRIVKYIHQNKKSKINIGNIDHINQTNDFYKELCKDITEVNKILQDITKINCQILPFFEECKQLNHGMTSEVQDLIKSLWHSLFIYTVQNTNEFAKITNKNYLLKNKNSEVIYAFLKYLQISANSEFESKLISQFQERYKLLFTMYAKEKLNSATKHQNKNNKSSSETVVTGKNGMLIRDNNYGTLEEDTTRRDFTLNSLYYDVVTSNIHDFHNGIQAIIDRKVDIIGEPTERYREDPVRMLRAIRFSAKLEMEITPRTAIPIKNNAHLLREVSNARMYDEMGKMFLMGSGLSTFKMMEEYNVLKPIFPTLTSLINSKKTPEYRVFIEHFLENTDARIANKKEGNLCFMYAAMLWPVLHKTFEESVITFDILLDINQLALDASCPETPVVKLVQYTENIIEQITSTKCKLISSTNIVKLRNKMKIQAQCHKAVAEFITLIKTRLKKEFLSLSNQILNNQSQFTAFPWFIFNDILQIWYLQYAFNFTQPENISTFIKFGRFKASLDFLEYRCRLNEKLVFQFEFWDNAYQKNIDKIQQNNKRLKK